MTEVDRIKERYDKRALAFTDNRYNMLTPDALLTSQEKERALVRWLRTYRLDPAACHLLEVGCGSGNNLVEFLRLGFLPENLVGNELLPERAAQARHRLPAVTQVLAGDASVLDLPDNSFEVVFQSTVFTSILDDAFQQALAARMWALTRPGGGVLWYDFVYNNPANRDVRGIPPRRVRELFPAAPIKIWRLTLAPPISRMVTRIHPALYHWFNIVPLRTHILCWISKPE